GNRAGGVVGVQRTENLVAGERGANGDFGRFEIADFADHDDVRVLPQNRTQSGGESEITPWTHRDLCDTGQFVFDRVFNGENFQLGRVDALQYRVKRGGFAAACGAGGEEEAVGLLDQLC